MLILAGFDSFLRTGEMLSLTFSDFVIDDNNRGVIRLAHTKSGQRHAAFEAAVIADPLVGMMYRVVKKTLPARTHPDHYIYPGSQHVFYKLFHQGFAWLGVTDAGFQPYSVRRGGATAYFRRTRNIEATLDRGRWASTRVARIYVNDGLAKQVELNFGPEVLFRLTTMSKALDCWLTQQ